MPIAPARLALILAGFLLLVSLASLLLGAGATIDELWHGDPFAWSLVPQLRAPRLVLALAAGSLLALCGASLQAQFRNPLAEPGLIGVSPAPPSALHWPCRRQRSGWCCRPAWPVR